MFTKILALVSLSLLVASSSYAHQVVCDGNYAVYHFRAQASLNSSDTHVRGPINVTVTGAGQTRTAALNASSSDIQVEHHIRATGSSAQGSGSLDTTYDAGSNFYRGTLKAHLEDRDVNVSVNCGIYLD